MIKNILKQWKSHPLGILLILLGYTFGILIVSIGISGVNEARINAYNSTSGNPDHYSIIHITSNKIININFASINSILSEASQTAEIQLLNIQGTKITDHDSLRADIVPVMYQNTPEWQVPLLKGRHFNNDEAISSKHVAIIGKKIAEGLRNNTGKIIINNEQFDVIGVVGNSTQDTQWDNAIYIPYLAIPKIQRISLSKISELTLVVRKNGGSASEISKHIASAFKSIKGNEQLNITFEKAPDATLESVTNTIVTTTVFAGIILFISIVNVMNLCLFWILDRRKDIAIQKALGAPDILIVLSIIYEMISVALIAASISIVVQYLLGKCLFNTLQSLGISFEVTITNWIFSMLVAFICGLVTSITPARMTLKMEPAEALRIN